MKERNIILRKVVPVAIALLVLAGFVLAVETIDVTIKPQSLSMEKNNPPWLLCKANVDPYNARDIDECTLAVEGEEPIYAVKVGCEEQPEDSNVVVFFDCDDVKQMLGGVEPPAEVELTLTIIIGGDEFEGSGTIKVRP